MDITTKGFMSDFWAVIKLLLVFIFALAVVVVTAIIIDENCSESLANDETFQQNLPTKTK